jgi:hypothetical protein
MRFGVVVLALLAGCHTRDHCVVGEQRSCSCDNAFVGIERCTAEGEFSACGACLQADAGVRPDAPADAAPDAPPDATLPIAPTGATCGSALECAGVNAACLGGAEGFPGGYCVSECTPSNVDTTTGLSTDCPGAGWCGGQTCFAACTASNGSAPCRAGYSCTIQGCFPAVYSQCDPNVAGSCAGAVCFDLGFDVFGQCAMTTCDVFAQGCPLDPGGSTQGCYIANALGEAACRPTGGGTLPICRASPDCAPGNECHLVGQVGTCRPYCGGPGAVACATGTCSPLSPTIPTTTVGVCL